MWLCVKLPMGVIPDESKRKAHSSSSARSDMVTDELSERRSQLSFRRVGDAGAPSRISSEIAAISARMAMLDVSPPCAPPPSAAAVCQLAQCIANVGASGSTSGFGSMASSQRW